MILTSTIALGAGALLGWLARSARHSTHARICEELFSRKLKLAESDREQAVRALNDNRLEMATFDERFAALDVELERLRTGLAPTEQARAAAQAEADRRGEELATLRVELLRAQQLAEEALHECAESAVERDRLSQELGGLHSTLQARHAEVDELSLRLSDRNDEHMALASAFAVRGDALDAVRRECDELLEERQHALAELGRRAAELVECAALAPRLALALGALAERDGQLLARDTALAAAQARLAELELLPERLRALEAARATAERDHALRFSELERAARATLADECESAAREVEARNEQAAALAEQARDVVALRARLEPLMALPAQLAAATTEVEALTRGLELERTARSASEAHATALQHATEDGEQERATLADELARSNACTAQLEVRAQALDDRAGELEALLTRAIADLESAVSARAQQAAELDEVRARLAALDAELVRERERARAFDTRALESETASKATSAARDELEARLARTAQRGAALERQLEREHEKRREGDARAVARKREWEAEKRGAAALAKQLAALGASHRAKQLEIDRRAARIEELERAVRERDERIRALAASAREQVTRTRTPAAAAKRAGAAKPPARGAAERDDLTRIAGIGPVLERKLQRLGLKTYRQLAALSRDELDKLATRLGCTAERIRREGWIAAARGELRARGT